MPVAIVADEPGRATHRLGRAVAIASWLAIGLATLTPIGGGNAGGDPWCIACGPGWAADAIANVLLFVPLGAGLSLAGARPRAALAMLALTTLAIELLQWRLVTGRDASLSDLLTNVAGGALGFWAIRRSAVVLRPAPPRALLFALAWSALWLAGTATTAWALAPSLPASLWWAHWRVADDVGTRSDGRAPVVLDASLATVPIDTGPVRQWPTLRAGLLQGGAMAVRAVLPETAAPTEPTIALIDDADSESELLALRRSRRGVAFFFRTRVASFRLRSPAIAIGSVGSPMHADTVRLRGALADGRLQLSVDGTNGHTERSLALSPNWGWSFLMPDGYALGSEARICTAIWIAGLVLPIGYWATCAASLTSDTTRSVASAAVVAPAVGLWMIPPLFDLPPIHWSEWAALAGGLAIGAGAARAWHVSQRAAPPVLYTSAENTR